MHSFCLRAFTLLSPSAPFVPTGLSCTAPTDIHVYAIIIANLPRSVNTKIRFSAVKNKIKKALLSTILFILLKLKLYRMFRQRQTSLKRKICRDSPLINLAIPSPILVPPRSTYERICRGAGRRHSPIYFCRPIPFCTRKGNVKQSKNRFSCAPSVKRDTGGRSATYIFAFKNQTQYCGDFSHIIPQNRRNIFGNLNHRTIIELT